MNSSQFLLMITLAVMPQASLNQGQAMAKAKTIWGPDAQVAKQRFNSGFVYEVGCTMQKKFVVVGQSTTSWEAAFASVNMAINGRRMITAVARDAAGNTTETTVPVWVCNP
jgi:hypothetical protein